MIARTAVEFPNQLEYAAVTSSDAKHRNFHMNKISQESW